MRLVPPSIAVFAVLTALAAGCGSSEDGATNTQSSGPATTQGSTTPATPAPAGAGARACAEPPAGIFLLRVTATDCPTGEATAAAWTRDRSCWSPAGASRYSCRIDAWSCLAVAGDRGAAVSCSRPGSSIAFLARRKGAPAA